MVALALVDAGCGSGDGSERGRAMCFDGVDNDGDGLTDCADPYCKVVCEEICTDTVDNDGDGLNGCDDPKCAGKPCYVPREICGNDVDDDENGLRECDDPACADVDPCRPPPVEICDNGADDDQNGVVDCNDPACAFAPTCEQCDNGIDDDGNGLTDCDDSRCRAQCGLIEQCTGGLDEDQDAAVDCADTDCKQHASCISGCRVRGSGASPYADTCRAGYICTCAGAPGCPTENPNAGELVGDIIGVAELCEEPQTCEDGGGCRTIDGVYTLRFRRAGARYDDPLNDPELYVEVNGERITPIEDTYELECDDCYRLVTLPDTPSLSVALWDYDALPNPVPGLPDIEHSDLVLACDFVLDETTLKHRGLTCSAYEGYVELTIEPHPG